MENVDKARPKVQVNLGGQQRSLGYTMDAMARAFEITGKSMLKGELDHQNPKELVVLVWAGLVGDDESLEGEVMPDGRPDPELKKALKMVGKWITIENLQDVADAVREAFERAKPKEKKSKGAPTEKNE